MEKQQQQQQPSPIVLTDDFNLTKLFIDKNVNIFLNHEKIFTITLKTIRDIYQNTEWNIFYNFITSNVNDLNKKIPLKKKLDDNFSFINLIIFNLGQYKEFTNLYTAILNQFESLFGEENITFNIEDQTIKINNTTITSEIWDYIIYILKLSYGEKVSKPLTFDSKEAKEFYQKQQLLEEKIRRTKQKGQEQQQGQDNSTDGVMKIFLTIIYAFPSLTIDYLFNQTMAQIQWLQHYAAGSVSYEVNARAFAAGNMKKGSKLDFFIK